MSTNRNDGRRATKQRVPMIRGQAQHSADARCINIYANVVYADVKYKQNTLAFAGYQKRDTKRDPSAPFWRTARTHEQFERANTRDATRTADGAP